MPLTKDEFFKSTIGSDIYWKGEKKKIDFLKKNLSYCALSLEDIGMEIPIYSEHLSLTPPKEKKKLYRFVLRSKVNDHHFAPYGYYTDESHVHAVYLKKQYEIFKRLDETMIEV